MSVRCRDRGRGGLSRVGNALRRNSITLKTLSSLESVSSCCTFPNPPRRAASFNVWFNEIPTVRFGQICSAKSHHVLTGWWRSFLDFLLDSESNHNNWPELDLWIRIHKPHYNGFWRDWKFCTKREAEKNSPASKYINLIGKKYLNSTRN